MKTKETKDNGPKSENNDFGCWYPKSFQKMFQKMGQCFPGQGDITDISATKDSMMKNMMEMCCGPKTADTKESTKH
ncbi:MAG: hypothetical protein HKO79_07875 [Desulfobacterales bacterium]|nr:hypothetical protein [Deltaproteobacteria bacterium]NNL42399.1 hypothetical protein [Desulfobacterales bacterium]